MQKIRTTTVPIITVFILILILFNCSQSPAIYQAEGRPLLAGKIKKAINDSGLSTNIGIKIIDPANGKTLYELNADNLYTPASNNKIYTAAAAYHFLGSEYRFTTGIWVDSTVIAGGKCNRLVLKAGGDPDFSLSELDSLATIVSEQISAIDTIIIDNTILDATYWGEGWMWDEGSWWYAAQIDAMSLNDNCIDIDITPGEISGPPVIHINPATEYVTINNWALSTDDTTDLEDLSIKRHWWEFSNQIDITGELLVTEERDTLYRNIHNPALFTGNVFKELLVDKGILVSSPVRMDTLPSHFIELTAHKSKPLPAVIENFLKASDNLSGELLVKTIGRQESDSQGNWNNGLTAVKTFINDSVGIDTTAMRMADGSGVSRYNLTSPTQLVHILNYVHQQDYSQLYMDALPIAGIDGTLENRMEESAATGKILAKTGTLSGASSLSGFAFRPNGKPLIFSIMVNGYTGSSYPIRSLQDEICKILATY